MSKTMADIDRLIEELNSVEQVDGGTEALRSQRNLASHNYW